MKRLLPNIDIKPHFKGWKRQENGLYSAVFTVENKSTIKINNKLQPYTVRIKEGESNYIRGTKLPSMKYPTIFANNDTNKEHNELTIKDWNGSDPLSWILKVDGQLFTAVANLENDKCLDKKTDDNTSKENKEDTSEDSAENFNWLISLLMLIAILKHTSKLEIIINEARIVKTAFKRYHENYTATTEDWEETLDTMFKITDGVKKLHEDFLKNWMDTLFSTTKTELQLKGQGE